MTRVYLIIALIVVIILFFGFHRWNKKQDKAKLAQKQKQEPTLGITTAEEEPVIMEEIPLEEIVEAEPIITTVEEPKQEPVGSSTYDPDTIIMQLRANPSRPFMGYELLQTLLANEFRFGEKDIFHRYERDNGTGPILFSLAAATQSGAFEINNMGACKCGGLVLFMHLDKKKKLMRSFDLMLDCARQIVEDLGGEILNEFGQTVDAQIIKQWREKICKYEDKNLYTMDLLDNL